MAHSKKTGPTPRHQIRLDAALAAEIRRIEKARGLMSNVDKEVYEAGMELFEDSAALAEWLATPQPHLREKSPLVVLGRPGGRKEVLNLLGALTHGAYL